MEPQQTEYAQPEASAPTFKAPAPAAAAAEGQEQMKAPSFKVPGKGLQLALRQGYHAGHSKLLNSMNASGSDA
jgi:hypothetical protein